MLKICLVINKDVVKISACFTLPVVSSELRNGLYTAQNVDCLSCILADKCFILKKFCSCHLK